MNAVSNSEMEWQVRRIPFDAITVDPAIQQRAAGTSQDVVDEYGEAMRSGAAFPPIDVFSNDDATFHRKRREASTVVVLADSSEWGG